MSERGNELKGSVFTLSVLHIENTSPDEILHLLQQKSKQAPKFFEAAPLVINVENLSSPPNFDAIQSAIMAAGFIPVGVTGIQNDEIRTAAKSAGLAILTSRKDSQSDVIPHTPKESIYKTPSELREAEEHKRETPSESTTESDDSGTFAATKVVQGNIRSGQQIYSKGPIVILGSVSNGAEIISDDSIHVYGSLRGRALAGAIGNSTARIFCGRLEAELISIAGHYLPSESLPAEFVGKEVQIQLSNEKIIFDKLTT